MRLHRFAIAVALATWVLTIFGGVVSTTESGLACPDWPLCEGKFIPQMVDGKQYEHSHRLVASFVGVMMFGLCALIIKYRRHDRLLLGLGIVGAVLVSVQAVLGAFTVILKLPWWVTSAHFATAMGFFGLSVTLAFLTRQRLAAKPRTAEQVRLGRAVLPVVVLVYLQLVAGAVMRHLRGGLACGYEILTCQGSLWPTDAYLSVHAHMVHRLLGVLSALAIVGLSAWLWRQPSTSRAARAMAVLLSVGVVAQVALGVLTVLWSRELVTMNTHSTLGAALFALLVSLYWVVAPVPAARPVPAAARDVAPIGAVEA